MPEHLLGVRSSEIGFAWMSGLINDMSYAHSPSLHVALDRIMSHRSSMSKCSRLLCIVSLIHSSRPGGLASCCMPILTQSSDGLMTFPASSTT